MFEPVICENRHLDIYLFEHSCLLHCLPPSSVRYLFISLSTHLVNGVKSRCRRLPEIVNTSDNYIETVVQPDIVVVCDRNKLDDKGCKGAPDLIIEILSPSTAGNDLTVKYELYERHGVKEYWIIHPAEMTLLVYHLSESGNFGVPERYAGVDKVPVLLLGELVIDLGEVFAD